MTIPPQMMDPHVRSWVSSANDPAGDFPVQNLPLCAFSPAEDPDMPERPGLAIGDQVLDVTAWFESGLLDDAEEAGEAVEDWIDGVMTPESLRVLRVHAFEALQADASARVQKALREMLIPASRCVFSTPLPVGDYTDFYASIHHASTVGAMFRPEQPLLPNYKHVPIGYHGRASTVIASGEDVVRPHGQLKAADAPAPVYAPTRELDFELEVGAMIGRHNPRGTPVPIGQARDAILGLLLVNDWSARDVQRWEYQPLGPFLAKSFATSVSPFLVSLDALAPFRVPAFVRPAGDPAPLPYLQDAQDQSSGGFDIRLEVLLTSAKMRAQTLAPVRITRAHFRDMYWTFSQMVAHHTSNGCSLGPGDLLASGTVSNEAADARGCLLERTWRGRGEDGKPLPREAVSLPTGETRTFLEDGDEVLVRGWCEREGYRRIGFGTCRAVVLPAVT